MASSLDPAQTKEGTLPPFEVAKAYAFEQVLSHVQKHLGKSARLLLGEDKATFIARHLELQGGGKPNMRTVFKAIKKCSQPGWYPGQVIGKRTGRPPAQSSYGDEAPAGEARSRKGPSQGSKALSEP